jgi:hypothetical protein
MLPAAAIAVPPALSAYANRLLGFDPFTESGRPVRMEEFFKGLFYDVQSAPAGRRRREAADLYADMVTVYATVLRRTTNWICRDGRRGGPVGRLIAAAVALPEDLTIVTFNHDLVVENEITKRARLQERWCLPEGYGTFGSQLSVSHPGGDVPLMRRHLVGCDHSRTIRILKLHGSLNWYVRMRTKKPPVSVLLGEGGARSPSVTMRREIPAQVVFTRSGTGRTQWRTWPLIVPPVYGKQLAITGLLANVCQDAYAAVAATSRVVFVGYSLPPADIEAEKMFQRALTDNTDLRTIEVVNPDPASSARYASLFPRPMRWFPDLDQFIGSEW